ncbi:hypothetical protein J132_08011 [Termitomyces sp. J132]|nr:hypothetical protein J132_08011 [Termitomyces sp. J132]
MAIPPIGITLELASNGYANQLHKLTHTNPITELLPEEWQRGDPAVNPPPLSNKKRKRNKRPVKLMQLEKVARRTHGPMDGENINPFVSPPWRRTAGKYGA